VLGPKTGEQNGRQDKTALPIDDFRLKENQIGLEKINGVSLAP